jgi:Spy/CpxP family protein refolding chaperone
MLYEPPKTKKYILIFGTAVALAILVLLAIQLFYKSEESQVPVAKLSSQAESRQQKIQGDMKEAAKKLKEQPISEQKIREDMNAVSEEMKKMPSPSQEEMQKVSDELN